MTTTTVSDDVARLATVTPITAAPSYSLHLANDSTWRNFTIPCYDVDAAAALAAELDKLGVATRTRAKNVTVRYNQDAPPVPAFAENVAMVAMMGEYVDADMAMAALVRHQESDGETAEVFVL